MGPDLGMPQEELGVWRDFCRDMSEVGGPGGQRQRHRGGRDRTLGGSCDRGGGGQAVMWPFEERIEADFFPDLCLDCCRIAVVCSLLVCSPFKGGEGSSTGWLPQCLRCQLTAHLGF